MPNWEHSNYRFFAKEQEPIDDFHEKITDAIKPTDTVYPASSFGDAWLGNVIDKFNCKREADLLGVRYRGEVTDLDEEVDHDGPDRDDGKYKNNFGMGTRTAWAPMTAMWELIKLKNPQYRDIDYVLATTGENLEEVANTDIDGAFFPERYFFNSFCDSGAQDDSIYMDFFKEEDYVKFIESMNEKFNSEGHQYLVPVNDAVSDVHIMNENMEAWIAHGRIPSTVYDYSDLGDSYKLHTKESLAEDLANLVIPEDESDTK